MNAFRYQALQGAGNTVSGVIEAEDRRSALALLGQRGLFPSNLEACSTIVTAAPHQDSTKIKRRSEPATVDSHDRVTSQPARGVVAASTTAPQPAGFRFRSGIRSDPP